MSIGLLGLLDDVAAIAKLAATSLDDVAAQATKAGAKAAHRVQRDRQHDADLLAGAHDVRAITASEASPKDKEARLKQSLAHPVAVIPPHRVIKKLLLNHRKPALGGMSAN